MLGFTLCEGFSTDVRVYAVQELLHRCEGFTLCQGMRLNAMDCRILFYDCKFVGGWGRKGEMLHAPAHSRGCWPPLLITSQMPHGSNPTSGG
jgi:hypothetical protein